MSTAHAKLLAALARDKLLRKAARSEGALISRYPHVTSRGAPRSPSPSAAKPRRPFPRGRIAAVYDYRDALGDLRYQVVRFAEPKDFRQRTPKPGGGWVWYLDGAARLLYRLPQVLQTVEHHGLVVACEGEKDVLALERLGLCATTCSEGAGAWSPRRSMADSRRRPSTSA